MSLFNFFKDTKHEITIHGDERGNLDSHVVCTNCTATDKEVRIGSDACVRSCKHCVGCTIRYANPSTFKLTDGVVECACGHNNIHNKFRRLKFVMNGKERVSKYFYSDGSIFTHRHK